MLYEKTAEKSAVFSIPRFSALFACFLQLFVIVAQIYEHKYSKTHQLPQKIFFIKSESTIATYYFVVYN